MEFTVWDFVISGMGLLMLAFVIEILIMVIIYGIIRPKYKGVFSIVPFIPWFGFPILILVLILTIIPMMKWGQVLDVDDRAVDCGYVEDIAPNGIYPLFYDGDERRFWSPSSVTIDGQAFFILASKNMNVGDYIEFVHTTTDHAILQWHSVPEGTLPQPLPEKPETPQKPAALPLMTAGQLIPCFAITLVFAFWLRRRNLRTGKWKPEKGYADNLVAPRKISLQTCLLEFLITAFALISLMMDQLALAAFLGIGSAIFWGLRYGILQTSVWYEDESFIYSTFRTATTISVGDISRAEFITTREGSRALEICMKNGRRISLNENDFTGLDSFFSWIEACES